MPKTVMNYLHDVLCSRGGKPDVLGLYIHCDKVDPNSSDEPVQYHDERIAIELQGFVYKRPSSPQNFVQK